MEKIGGRLPTPDLLQHYRGWCSAPRQNAGGSAIGFPYMYITTGICPGRGADVDIAVTTTGVGAPSSIGVEQIGGWLPTLDLLEHYQGWCSAPLQNAGGSAIGIPYMYITTVICPGRGGDVAIAVGTTGVGAPSSIGLEQIGGWLPTNDMLEHYRGWCSAPRQNAGASAIGCPYMYITTVIATPAATPQSAPPLSRIVARPPPDPERERDLFSRGARIACVSANFSARWHSSRGNMANFLDRSAQIGSDCVRERQLFGLVAHRVHETPL